MMATMPEPRKRAHETVAEFIRRRNPTAALPKALPAWVFSWWFAVLFVLVLLVIPVAVAILWTFPQ